MARSSKKGLYIDAKLLKKVLAQKKTNKKTPIKTWARASQIPPEFVGHTFQVHKEEKLDWKTVKFELAKLRKSLKSQHGISLTWKQIAILMKFLTIPYNEWDD